MILDENLLTMRRNAVEKTRLTTIVTVKSLLDMIDEILERRRGDRIKEVERPPF